jgi:hypothetical protein
MELNELTDAIEKRVIDYTSKVAVQIEAELEATADKIIDYIKANAPRSGGPKALADSFVKKSYGEGANRMIVIYSKTSGGLVHLLEFGFKHRSGKFVAARPFLRPGYETFTPVMLEDIKQIIQRAGN